ncbi:MAG: iron complex outerrane recepter protein [Sphingomonadales bacterium]|jgi:iron complex outermembrane receptor protein|nr:iron complex outerrane recepter protein [Sphingomonadales bacterium]
MTRSRTLTALRLGAAVAAIAAIPAPLWAQEILPPSSSGTDEEAAAAANQALDENATAAPAGDGDIVVTARRRAESLQDVPIAVTAYQGEALERAGATDITDLSDTTPNVTLETSRGTNTTLTAFIRGVGQQDPVAGFEAGVGLYLDDVYLNRPQAAVLDIYDVERIEVLRGPQGTLYGRNTIGGAIKYVTRRLSSLPSFSARANLGTYKQLDLILSASTPVSEQIRIGGSIARLSRDGFGNNLTTGQENYNRDLWAARGTIEIEPSDALFVRISGDYTKDDSNPRGGHRLIPSLFTHAPVLDDVYDTRGGLVLPKQEIEAYGGAVHVELKLSDQITLRDIAAYRKDKSSTPIDFDALPTIDVDVPAIYRNKQLSNEFQLLYESKRIQGLVGLYYLDANANNIFDVILHETGLTVPPGPAQGPVPFFTASTFGDVDTKTWAAFADFTFNLSDQLAVSVGGRYTNDKRSARVFKENLRNGPQVALGGVNPTRYFAVVSDFNGEDTFKQFTPRASVTFKPNDDNTIYASYSKGFKGGGFDPRANSPQAGDSDGDGDIDQADLFEFFLFDPETVDSYEVGYKASLFDRRARIALAAFYADYKNVQVPGSVGCVIGGIPTFCGVTTNAGAATFKGLEGEFFANIMRLDDGSRLNFTGTVGYLDAQYDEFLSNVPAGFADNGTTDQTKGVRPVDVAAYRHIQNTPKLTMSATVDVTTPLGGGDINASTTLSYRSKTYQFETASPFLDQRGYALWDANLVWTSRGDRFSIGLHAKNILDKQYITSGYQFLNVNPVTGVPILSATRTSAVFNQPGVASSLGREGVATAFYGNPRQVFLSLGVKF